MESGFNIANGQMAPTGLRNSFMPVFDTSVVNLFSPPSTSSAEISPHDGKTTVTMEYNRKIVNEIINKIFDDKTGTAEVSSSHCSTISVKSEEYNYDKRLKYWKDMLSIRHKIANRIVKKTEKKKEDLLFNKVSTVDQPDKQNIIRLLDYGERLNPVNLMARKLGKLPEINDFCKCKHLEEIQETLPHAECIGYKKVEIIGLPKVTKTEIMGDFKKEKPQKTSKWIKSKNLENYVYDHKTDIGRVVEFYPDLEKLQIVGESIYKKEIFKHNSEIRLLDEIPIFDISSDTIVCEDIGKTQPTDKVEEVGVYNYAVKINEYIFHLHQKRSAKIVEVETRFECDPFETVDKSVLRVENVGRKILNCEWAHRSFYEKNSQLLKATDEEFIFNHKPFRLTSGEVREVIVRYQPRKVDIVKSKWVLKLDIQFFCRKLDAVILRFAGKCRPPIEYVNKINNTQKCVIDKSNLKMMRKLTDGLASLTPLIKPNEVICPYNRTLNEQEIFEFNNPGYTCKRFHDLQLLKAIYQRLKYPRDRPWDLYLDSLKAMILRQEQAEQRALLYTEMFGVLESMKEMPIDFEEKLKDNTERDHTRFMYVKGLVNTAIDEWEDIVHSVKEAFLKPAMKEYKMQLIMNEEEEEEEVFKLQSINLDLYLLDDDDLKKVVTKKLPRRKAYRDALYVQTYSHLCNVIEDIVSVVESTEII